MSKTIYRGTLAQVMPHYMTMTAKYLNREINGTLRMSRAPNSDIWSLTWDGAGDPPPLPQLKEPQPYVHTHESPEACREHGCEMWNSASLHCFSAYHELKQLQSEELGLGGSTNDHSQCQAGPGSEMAKRGSWACVCPCHTTGKGLVRVNGGQPGSSGNGGNVIITGGNGSDIISAVNGYNIGADPSRVASLEAEVKDLKAQLQAAQDALQIQQLKVAQPRQVYHIDLNNTSEIRKKIKLFKKKQLQNPCLKEKWNPLAYDEDINIPVRSGLEQATVEVLEGPKDPLQAAFDEIDRRCEEDVRAIRAAYRSRKKNYKTKKSKETRALMEANSNKAVVKRLLFIYLILLPALGFGIFSISNLINNYIW
jgi:hypothetical protein